MSRVLIVDKSIDRKKRIAALKQRGFTVFPALQLAEARSRCRPGAYDLIIVNAQDEPDGAAAWCDELRARTPAQLVLMVASNVPADDSRDYIVQDEPEMVAQRAATLLNASVQGQEENKQGNPTRPEDRRTA